MNSVARPSYLRDTFRNAANDYYKRGWTPLALGLDSNGFPKRPLALAWTSLPRTQEAIRNQPWNAARGIGIALGAQSSNLGAIDIDHVALAQAVVAELQRSAVLTRAVWTIRKRVHLFFIEAAPSNSTAFKCTWHDMQIGIELKANGTQVATVPTPGYELAIDAEPLPVPSLRDAWLSLCRRLSVAEPTERSGTSAGYPSPWQPQVSKGDRNKAIYIEAHKLREAGMPLDMALDIMQGRIEKHYAPGELTWQEVRATVESAYRKGAASGTTAKVVRWRHGKPILPSQEITL